MDTHGSTTNRLQGLGGGFLVPEKTPSSERIVIYEISEDDIRHKSRSREDYRAKGNPIMEFERE